MARTTVLLVIALLLLAWSSLTVLKATNVPAWILALVAGELGHYVALIAGAVAIWAGCQVRRKGGHRVVALLAVVAAVGAAGLFLRPIVSAQKVAHALPHLLQAAFPGEARSRAVLQWQRLVAPPRTMRVAVESYIFAHGETAEALILDFYRTGRVTPAPAVIVIHGGGWDSGDRHQFRAWNHALAAQGFAVAAISYRLAPAYPWPAQREDTLAALTWVKAHAAELNVDPTRLVLFGRSAGGQIATAVGYSANDPAIRGVIALYAPHDLRFVWSIGREDDVLNSVKLMRQYLGGAPDSGREDLYDSASAQLMVRPDTPPTLLLHGTLDELVWAEHSRRLAKRLQEERVPSLLVELPWATHAFELHRHGPGGQIAAAAIEYFLSTVFTPNP